jgi:hypothetical protein
MVRPSAGQSKIKRTTGSCPASSGGPLDVTGSPVVCLAPGLESHLTA